MIAWWGWLVIWTCLVLALVAVLAISAVRLVQKGVAVLDELDQLAQKTEILEQAADSAEETSAELAILAGTEQTRRARALVREAALDRKAARHDGRISRARRIIRFDASTRTWFKVD